MATSCSGAEAPGVVRSLEDVESGVKGSRLCVFTSREIRDVVFVVQRSVVTLVRIEGGSAGQAVRGPGCLSVRHRSWQHWRVR